MTGIHFGITDPYAELGIASGASDQEVKSAYNKMIKEWHPDRNKSRDAHERTIKITEAYQLIKEQRKQGYITSHPVNVNEELRNFAREEMKKARERERENAGSHRVPRGNFRRYGYTEPEPIAEQYVDSEDDLFKEANALLYDVPEAKHYTFAPGLNLDRMEGPTGDTPLISALKNHRVVLARALIEEGANPYLVNRILNDALSAAAFAMHDDLVELILQTNPGAPEPIRDRALQSAMFTFGDLYYSPMDSVPLMLKREASLLHSMEILFKNDAGIDQLSTKDVPKFLLKLAELEERHDPNHARAMDIVKAILSMSSGEKLEKMASTLLELRTEKNVQRLPGTAENMLLNRAAQRGRVRSV